MARVRLVSGLVVLFWVLVVGGFAGPYTGRLAEVQENGNAAFLPASAESTRVAEIEAAFRDSDVIPAVVVYERRGGISEADLAAIGQDVDRLRDVEGVLGETSPPIVSEDGRAAQVFVPLDGSDNAALPAIVGAVRAAVDQGSGPEAYVSGAGGLAADLISVFESIDVTLLAATGLVVVLILLVVYRSPFLWILPLLSVAMAYTASAGVNYALAANDVITLSGQSQGILTVLIFGAGTDYALLLVARYREELHLHQRPVDAMRAALRGAVPAIAASAVTVILGLLCLLASDLGSNRSLGPVAAVGIAAAFVAMTTLLPALLLLVGRRVFWPRVPRPDGENVEGEGVWPRVANALSRSPRRYAAASTLALVVLAGFAPTLDADGLAQEETFTTEVESVTGQQVIERHFAAGSGLPVVVVSRADAADRVTEVLAQHPDVSAVEPLRSAGPQSAPRTLDGRALLTVTLDVPGDGAQAQRVVQELRDGLDDVPGADALVGGTTASNLDVQTASTRDNRVIIPLVLAVIVLVLGLLLRSVVAPVLLTATVVLSFAATLGICALVFEHVFGFAGADGSFPLYAFVFLVALGVDYNIFLMTRVREETVRDGPDTGVLRGLSVTGGVITSAGVVLAATFAVLGVLPLVVLAELGFAVAVGVLLDTLLVRSVQVPAVALLIGRWTWWPSGLSRPAP
jgi:RND superfamily putative drug exporter